MLINNETKNETMLTSIVGMERCDMVLQLAKLIRNAKTASKENSYSSVLLIDNSFSQELYNMVSIGDSGVADYRGITIINNVGYSPKEFIKYDHILIYHGLRVEPVLLMESDHIYVITNYEKNLNKRIGRQFEAIDGLQSKRFTVIYRDKAGKKVSEKNVNHYACIPEKNIVSQHILKYDIKDYMLYLALTHNGSQKIKNYSEPFISALEAMVRQILNWEDKNSHRYFLKLVRKAK